MDDDDTAQALVELARDCLTKGDDKRAARLLADAAATRLLADAAYHAHHPETRQQVRELTVQRLEARRPAR
jgi:hypothetical protein